MRVKDRKKDDRQIYKKEKMNRLRNRIILRCIGVEMFMFKTRFSK